MRGANANVRKHTMSKRWKTLGCTLGNSFPKPTCFPYFSFSFRSFILSVRLKWAQKWGKEVRLSDKLWAAPRGFRVTGEGGVNGTIGVTKGGRQEREGWHHTSHLSFVCHRQNFDSIFLHINCCWPIFSIFPFKCTCFHKKIIPQKCMSFAVNLKFLLLTNWRQIWGTGDNTILHQVQQSTAKSPLFPPICLNLIFLFPISLNPLFPILNF